MSAPSFNSPSIQFSRRYFLLTCALISMQNHHCTLPLNRFTQLFVPEEISKQSKSGLALCALNLQLIMNSPYINCAAALMHYLWDHQVSTNLSCTTVTANSLIGRTRQNVDLVGHYIRFETSSRPKCPRTYSNIWLKCIVSRYWRYNTEDGKLQEVFSIREDAPICHTTRIGLRVRWFVDVPRSRNAKKPVCSHAELLLHLALHQTRVRWDCKT